jgi:peroxiredoxin
MIPDVGQRVPDFKLPDLDRCARSLGSLLAAGPLVLLFFRGHW